MGLHDLLAGIGIAIGLLGIVVVVVPGLPLIALSIVLWAFEEATAVGTTVAILAVGLTVTVIVLKYLHPGRRLRQAGIPRGHLLLAVLAGTIGFFVIPVVGAPIFFVAAIYLQQRRRLDRGRARLATRAALGAIALSVGIELAGGFVIAALWLAAAMLG